MGQNFLYNIQDCLNNGKVVRISDIRSLVSLCIAQKSALDQKEAEIIRQLKDEFGVKDAPSKIIMPGVN